MGEADVGRFGEGGAERERERGRRDQEDERVDVGSVGCGEAVAPCAASRKSDAAAPTPESRKMIRSRLGARG